MTPIAINTRPKPQPPLMCTGKPSTRHCTTCGMDTTASVNERRVQIVSHQLPFKIKDNSSMRPSTKRNESSSKGAGLRRARQTRLPLFLATFLLSPTFLRHSSSRVTGLVLHREDITAGARDGVRSTAFAGLFLTHNPPQWTPKSAQSHLANGPCVSRRLKVGSSFSMANPKLLFCGGGRDVNRSQLVRGERE